MLIRTNNFFQDESIYEFEGIHESEKLLRWLRYHYKEYDFNFSEFGGTNSSIYFTTALASTIWNGVNPLFPKSNIPGPAHRILHDPHNILDDSEKKELFEAVAFACQTLGIRLYASRTQCLESDDARLQQASCASVFAECHHLPVDVALSDEEQRDLKALSLQSDSDESKDERIIRTWINSLNLKNRTNRRAIRVTNLFLDIRNGVV
jgi:hypothetical protein